VSPLRATSLCLLLCLSALASGCLFPVIDFEEHSTARAVSVRAQESGAYRHSSSSARALQPMAAGDRRAGSGSKEEVQAHRPSVVEPIVPAPELPERVASCHQALHQAGIRFVAVAERDAPGVRWPIRLQGPIEGVSFVAQDQSPTFAILDCRLAVTLQAWARDLRRAGVRRVEYFSMYRPNATIAGTDTISGHAHGLAIDAARFVLHSGAVVDVRGDWEGRKRGQAPCPTRPDEARPGRLLRTITCSAADRKLFQVVLTPHYNKAHDNHVHLEIKPEVSWTYVR